MLQKTLYRWFGYLRPLNVSYDNGAKRKPTVVFIHGIGSSSAMWQQVVTQLQDAADVRVIGIDLLGFGSSHKPTWPRYNTQDHARAVAATLRRRGVRRCIIVGHSLGSLVAIELAKRRPRKITSLILCSPPLYTASDTKKWLPSRDELYKKLYQHMRQRIDRTIQLSKLYSKARPHRVFTLNEETLPAFMKSLEASIERQTSLQDLVHLACPISLLYGTFDPVIVGKNIRFAAKQNQRITIHRFASGHEIGPRYGAEILKTALEHLHAG